MPAAESPASAGPDDEVVRPGGVVLGLGDSTEAAEVIDAALRLARALDAPLEAVYVETPGSDNADRLSKVALALAKAQESGAMVAKLPASNVADGLCEHVSSIAADYLVVGHHRKPRRFGFGRGSLADQLLNRGIRSQLVLVPEPEPQERAQRPSFGWRGAPAQYAMAGLVVALTTVVAALLRQTTGLVSTSILYLFPVIAIAARSGLGPTLFAVVIAVLTHNALFLQPAFAFDALAVQSWVMGAVLLVGGTYTSLLTNSLRGRVKLADRSARQSASLATFAQRLTRLADWESTAEAVCEEIGTLLAVHTVMFREIDGRLVKVADHPSGSVLEPVDHVALEWVWEHGETPGTGASGFQAGNWQFHPLSTSLGVLAVIGLARPDGGSPISADQSVLLTTLLSQASLAHERLWLEDRMRRA